MKNVLASYVTLIENKYHVILQEPSPWQLKQVYQPNIYEYTLLTQFFIVKLVRMDMDVNEYEITIKFGHKCFYIFFNFIY